MKRKALSVSLILIGAGILLSLITLLICRFDFLKLQTDELISKTGTIPEDFCNIEINATSCDISIIPCNEEFCSVDCSTYRNTFTDIIADGDTLKINIESKSDLFGVTFLSEKVKINLPKKKYGSLKISSSSGNTDITGIECDTLSAQAHSGNISLKNVYADKKVSAASQSGNIISDYLNSADADIKSESGNISLENSLFSGLFAAECQSGNIKLFFCDASSLSLKAQSGNITGRLLSDKNFKASSGSGRIVLPDGSSDSVCIAETGSGNIIFE